MAEEEQRASLAGEEALDIWRQGKDAWNAWIDEHPNVDIDFSGVDFRKERKKGSGAISFAGFRFGEGRVSFSRARFGDGDVWFLDTNFGNGDVSFDRVSFGDGKVSFDHASFGKGDILFIRANFGDGDVSFFRTTFGEGSVSFYAANFGNGVVTFFRASFEYGDIWFNRARFGNGRFDLLLSHSKVENWFLEEVTFLGAVDINLSVGTDALKKLSLRGTRFDSVLYLIGQFACIPDLRLSKVSHHVDFSTLGVTLRWKPGPGWRRLAWRAEDKEDGPRLRRLKEVAEGARDHAAALRFAALENRANRWIRMGRLASMLDLAFSVTSDYGRSIARPTAWLLGLLALATGTLFWFSSPDLPSWNWGDQLDRAYDSVVLAATQAFAFLPPVKEVAAAANARLFGVDSIPRWAGMLALGHSLASFIFLFLIGLGLRNRFRL